MPLSCVSQVAMFEQLTNLIQVSMRTENSDMVIEVACHYSEPLDWSPSNHLKGVLNVLLLKCTRSKYERLQKLVGFNFRSAEFDR